jgi:GrpB-like predicted nucleotidyltransferase (UPF0157 family)
MPVMRDALVGTTLGLERGTVRVVAYDQQWPRLFEQAAAELGDALGPHALSVQHVGSTAVAGLSAKPILDVLVGIPNFENGRQLIPILQKLGYEYRPHEEIPDRHYFRRGSGRVRTHHLSLAVPDSHHYRVTIAFRDALRRDPELLREYADLKADLAARFPYDRESYLAGKSPFVQRVLQRFGLELDSAGETRR